MSRSNYKSYWIPRITSGYIPSEDQKIIIKNLLDKIQGLKSGVDLEHPEVRKWEFFLEEKLSLHKQNQIKPQAFINNLKSYIRFLEEFKSKAISDQIEKPIEQNIKLTKVCTNCGKSNKVENKFCGNCGKSLLTNK